MNGLRQFDGIKYFKPNSADDYWGEPHKIDRQLLLQLDALREFLEMPIYVTSGFRAQVWSPHVLGVASDIVVPNYKHGLFNLFLIICKFKFTGIGLYQEFTVETLRCGGFHVDVRRLKRHEHKSMWIGKRKLSKTEPVLPINNDDSPDMEYFKMDHDNLIALGILKE